MANERRMMRAGRKLAAHEGPRKMIQFPDSMRPVSLRVIGRLQAADYGLRWL